MTFEFYVRGVAHSWQNLPELVVPHAWHAQFMDAGFGVAHSWQNLPVFTVPQSHTHELAAGAAGCGFWGGAAAADLLSTDLSQYSHLPIEFMATMIAAEQPGQSIITAWPVGVAAAGVPAEAMAGAPADT